LSRLFPFFSLGACFLRGSVAAHFDETNPVSVQA
jgi:hypothetical protein